MKYTIVVSMKDNKYVAYCTASKSFEACGDTVSSALSSLRVRLICYLQDPAAEFEVVMEGRQRITEASKSVTADEKRIFLF